MKPIESLFELQGILIRRLFSIDEACRAWGIRYSLAGETLLGADSVKLSASIGNDLFPIKLIPQRKHR